MGELEGKNLEERQTEVKSPDCIDAVFPFQATTFAPKLYITSYFFF